MTSHRDQNAANRDQFGRQAASYARLTRGGGPGISTLALIDAVSPGPEDSLLDVGCGPGRLTLALAEHVGQVTGIDLTPEMLDQAEALRAELKVDNVRWLQGDILPMPFAAGEFSIVVTQATFHHLADPAAVLAEMMRVCKPGGRIAVNDLTFEPAQGAFFDEIEHQRDPSHLKVLSMAQLRGLGRAAGMKELGLCHYVRAMPLEAVLGTSLPKPGIMEKVRAVYREDAVSGADRLGLNAREENGAILVFYPMTMLAWRRD